MLKGIRGTRHRSGDAGTIAVVGLGRIGGSIGLALRQSSPGLRVVGHDREPSRGRQARQLGAIDHAEWNLIRACEGADAVVLALPPQGLRDTLEAVADDLHAGCLVTDTATIKGVVLQWAQELLPPDVAFVGGDPVVQTFGLGLSSARADLFRDKLYCLTPAANAPAAAVQKAVDLVRLLGAKPYFVDANEHDGLRAAVEHLPALLIALLLREVSRSPAPAEIGNLMGPLLSQARSLVSEQAATHPCVCLSNPSAIGHWSRVIRRALGELEFLLEAGDEEKLAAMFREELSGADTSSDVESTNPSLWRQWLGIRVGGASSRAGRDPRRD